MVDQHRFLLFLALPRCLLSRLAQGCCMCALTLAGGRREGVFSAAGTFVGGLVHVVAAAMGWFILLATSAAAFATVKYAGGGYLIIWVSA